MKVIF